MLPYVVAHGRWPHGTDWLNETAAETYVPLLSMLNEIVDSGRSPRITVGVTPVLSEQLADDGFQIELTAYLPEGSWGECGYHYIWLNQDTEWTWKLICADEARMQHLTYLLRDKSDTKLSRMVAQAGRELLLLQSSDWPFIISTTRSRDYANLRIENHHESFTRLADMAEGYDKTGDLDPDDWQFLLNSERRDALFPDLDVNWFIDDHTPS